MASSSVSTQRLTASRAGARRRRGSEHRPRGRAATRPEARPRVLHARGVGAILDTGLELLVSRFGICAGLAALCWIPFEVASELVLRSDLPSELYLYWSLLTPLPEYLTVGFVCGFVGTELLGREARVGAALRNGLMAMAGLLVIALVQVFSGVMVCLCGVGLFLPLWLLSVTPAVYVLERHDLIRSAWSQHSWPLRWLFGLLHSMGRGVRLVWGGRSFLRWLGWFAVSGLAIVVPLSGLPGALENPEVRLFLEQHLPVQGRPIELTLIAIGAVFLAISTAYNAVLRTVYYVDQRVRREALDLWLQLEELEGRAVRGR